MRRCTRLARLAGQTLALALGVARGAQAGLCHRQSIRRHRTPRFGRADRLAQILALDGDLFGGSQGLDQIFLGLAPPRAQLCYPPASRVQALFPTQQFFAGILPPPHPRLALAAQLVIA